MYSITDDAGFSKVLLTRGGGAQDLLWAYPKTTRIEIEDGILLIYYNNIIQKIPREYISTPASVSDTDLLSKLEFMSSGGFEWGAITGTLANQTDLQNELNNLENSGISAYYKIIDDISKLPPLTAGEYILDPMTAYLVVGTIVIANPIIMGDATTIVGINSQTDGFVYTGGGTAIRSVDATSTVSNILLANLSGGACIDFKDTTKGYTLIVKDCVFGVGKVADIVGGFVITFFNNFFSTTATGGIELKSGDFKQVAILNNIFDSETAPYHIKVTDGNYDSIELNSNAFDVKLGNTGILINGGVGITNNGGGSIVSNSFGGSGTYISGIEDDTSDWIIETNGKNVLSTSARRFVRKIRNKQQLIDFLALPNPSGFMYEIDGEIDMTGTSIVVPSTGLTFRGYGNNFSKLCTSSDNATLFTGGGNLFGNDLILEASGLNSKIFDVTDPSGNNAIEFVNVNFQNTTELGNLTGYRQGLILNGFFINVSEGFTFQGTWSGGMRIDTTLGLLFSGLTLFKSAVGHSFGSRFVSNMNHITGASATCYDFREDTFASDAGFQLVEANFSGAGTFVTGGITNTSIKSFWRDNIGVDDTFQGLVYSNNADTTTTITTSGTYAELAIVKTIVEETWFSSNSAILYNANYDSSLPINISIELFGSYVSGNNDQIEIEIRNYETVLAGGYTSLGTVLLTTNGGAGGDRTEAVSFKVFDKINLGDDIRVFARNNSSTTDITTSAGSKMIISKR